jgi:branched-chain amino acid transport system permease protein
MRAFPYILGLIALAVCPFVVTSPYYLHLLVTIAIFSILTLGLDVVFGYTGEVSVGHASLLGIGAYTAGVLAFHFNLGFWVALLWQSACFSRSSFSAASSLPSARAGASHLSQQPGGR